MHWRSTARAGELMVRREEQPQQNRATLLLDTRSSAHRGQGPGSSFEWAVGAVASIGVALLRQGSAVTLLLDDARPLIPPGVPVSEALLLESLADLALGAGRDLDPAVGRLRRGVDGVLVAVLGELDADDAARLARLRSGAGSCTAVLLDTPGWAGRPPAPGRTPAPPSRRPGGGSSGPGTATGWPGRGRRHGSGAAVSACHRRRKGCRHDAPGPARRGRGGGGRCWPAPRCGRCSPHRAGCPAPSARC